MKVLVIMIFCMGHILQISENYKILGVVPFVAKSHFVMFETVFKGLAEKGHEVDVVGHFPLQTPIPRYNDLSIRGSIPIYVNNLSISFVREEISSRVDVIDFIVDKAGLETCQIVFNTDVLKKLKHSKKKYDLIITEIFGCDCMLGFGHLFNAPVVSITTSVNLPWGGDRIGLPDNPSYIPTYITPALSHMNLIERVNNVINLLGCKFRYWMSAYSANKIAREYFGEDLPDIRELAYKTSLILLNSHFSVDIARPVVPNFIEVAGLHIPPVKPLPKHLDKIMNITSDYKGVIYLSMGSMVLTETFPTDKLTALFEAFKELPYKVLWKATREKMPAGVDIPSNIHFEPWLPQLDILCHPNTKLFISHGGLMGTQEAIFCGVPRIGIPLFGDQELNLRSSEAMGLALLVYYENINKNTILESIKKILESKSYSKNAKEVSKRFKDRPLSPLDTAVYWVEYVIRHKGAPHLRTVGADLPWYQYHLLDVGAILIGIFLTCLILVYYLVLFICHKLLNVAVPTNVKTKHD